MNVAIINRPFKHVFIPMIIENKYASTSSRLTSIFFKRNSNETTRVSAEFGHYFATDAKQGYKHKPKYQHFRSIFALTATAAFGASLYTRYLRDRKLASLPLAKDCALLDIAPAPSGQQQSTISRSQPKYNLQSLIETITRAGLIGSTKSVKDEVHVLRDWHAKRGYNGGIVVRDLTRPLFSLDFRNEADDDGEMEDNELVDNDASNAIINDNIDIDHINRRECYYLYYEIESNGRTRQQLFCRGTTLLADVLTCLQTWFVYDEELGCRVHHGFNQHANRIVEDVLPLLVPPKGSEGHARGSHATIEVCGHSLGGAVAMLVAIKLKKRGYAVTRVTSLAGPRFCWGTDEREILQKWLPKETIRIEDDLDVVTYLPPMGVSIGDKLWLAKDNVYMLPKDSLSEENDWTESFWFNLRLFETILNQSKTHRVTSYVNRLEQLVNDMNND
eukprot:CAMPEP_0183721114 /NCGR_PEP_ID=MMETSP0737-20130205/13513_1 /TAXON_ID=385413 /ORGANISM="Thalassiosira miniscula, Strain CCMP1093" /LENGTH=445 /DNA_ID=CAMNT_0025951085 /DNA_START=247 /DNA_END=1584 /DNA_ORIENTATION=-